MPIYEFTCNACKSPVSVFVRTVNSELDPKCDNCGSKDLTRQISQFSVPRLAGSVSDSGDNGDGMGGFGGLDDFGDDDF